MLLIINMYSDYIIIELKIKTSIIQWTPTEKQIIKILIIINNNDNHPRLQIFMVMPEPSLLEKFILFFSVYYHHYLVQIFITVLFCALSMYNLGFFKFQLENTWLFFIAIAVAVVVQIYMFCCNGGRTSP